VANFVKHESCPSCGSRDNLARYSDGSAWCFGCGYKERSDTSPFVGERNRQIETSSHRAGGTYGVSLPDDASNDIAPIAMGWLNQYQLPISSIIRAGFKWSKSWEQLLIPFYDEDGHLCCIQAKNFNPKRASKAKYYNTGEKSESRTIYSVDGRASRILVLTEDAVSAIKVSLVADAKPLLGTSIPREQIAAFKGPYNRLVVWLDADKWREGRNIADAAKLLGMDTKTILTERDPKEYDLETIRQLVC
jgi:Zn ribbon nucleic-acid-binding protein